MKRFRALVIAAFIAVICACSSTDYEHMKEGQPFAEAIVSDVSRGWDADKLISKADASMLKDHPESEIRKMIAECAKTFGPVREQHLLAGEITVAGAPEGSVLYIFAVKGDRLSARIRIALIKRGDDWRVIGFWLQS